MADLNQEILNAISQIQYASKDLMIDYRGQHKGSVYNDIQAIEEAIYIIKDGIKYKDSNF